MELAAGLAPTATVTKAIADRHNENAAPGDRVSGDQLRDRVRYHEGSVKVGNSPNKTTEPVREVSYSLRRTIPLTGAFFLIKLFT